MTCNSSSDTLLQMSGFVVKSRGRSVTWVHLKPEITSSCLLFVVWFLSGQLVLSLQSTWHVLFVMQLSFASLSTPCAMHNWAHGTCLDLEGSMHTWPLQSSEAVLCSSDICLKGGRKSWLHEAVWAKNVTICKSMSCSVVSLTNDLAYSEEEVHVLPLPAIKSNQNVIKGKADKACIHVAQMSNETLE